MARMEEEELQEQKRRFQLAVKQSTEIKNLAELVRRIDEDYDKVYTYWIGRSPMPAGVSKKIGKALGVRAAWLLTLEDDPDTEFAHIDEREKKLLTKFRITDERGRVQIQSSADSQPGEVGSTANQESA